MITKISKTKKKNLAQIAYEEIRDRIYHNKIQPGELINESSIAEELSISRTPVREALRMLASEDIIEVKDGVGTYVKLLSIKNIKDIFEVRKALEVIAIKTAIYKITELEITELENDFMLLKRKYDMGTLTKEEFANVDMKFHQLIFAKCENNYAKGIFEEMSLKIKQYQYISYESLNNSEESIAQHLQMINFIKDRNLKELITFLENHINWSLKLLLMEK
ncbi:GntR family transcriptional regulator [Natronincola ferrireducens]|uniref:DNA-binding transcriptional regulator, GntR family n=1 Tax=Natronincola ferrireducens TaxID=393762 RepID=A0A1G8XP14_9FIRM|nr:GntR family transcriptional regulator [Natronincola ferrireducens]SDJ92217.1 DNA-binding transcriptional regulator, GntR family [Natronincola ferrireducens]